MLFDYTVFDFETTGLSAERDRVIEMAAIRVRNGHVVGEFSTIVNHPDITELPAKITEITGITTEMMRAGMDEQISFAILNRMMNGNIIVAHNAAFDLGFLHHGFSRFGRTFTNPFIDTLTISRDRHYYPHKLENMCDRYGINLDGAHRALNDVTATRELLEAFHREEPIDAYVNRLGYLRKYDPPKWAPEYAVLVPTENRYEPRTAG